MEQTQEEIVNDLKKIHNTEEQKKKSREYYKQYYRENKDKYKKRYQENKAEILNKMKNVRQVKKKKSRGIFTIRRIGEEKPENIISTKIEEQP